MNFIISLEDAEKILAAEITEICDLPKTSVLNGLSLYGAELDYYRDQFVESIDPEEGFIVFESVNDTNSENNMIENDYETDDSYCYFAYQLKIAIYGDQSDKLSKLLKAKILLLDRKAVLALKGIQITKISNISSLNEFRNSSMWQRRDMTIDFVLRQKI